MAIKPSHAELEGFDGKKEVMTTSWAVSDRSRLSICTGWDGRQWMSTVRQQSVETGTFGLVVAEIPLSCRITCKDAHVIVVNEIKGREKDFFYVD